MCGRILDRPHNKLPFHRSSRPWTSLICLRLLAGLAETDQIQKWECLRLVYSRRSTVSFGYRCAVDLLLKYTVDDFLRKTDALR